MAEPSYVEPSEGVYRVTNASVLLDSISYALLDGHTAEMRCIDLPLNTMEGEIPYPTCV